MCWKIANIFLKVMKNYRHWKKHETNDDAKVKNDNIKKHVKFQH